MADNKAKYSTFSVNRNVDYSMDIAVTPAMIPVGTIQVPSGSILSRTGASKALLHIRGVPDSRLRNAQNKVQASRADEQGAYKTAAQTVLSPAFECFTDSSVSDPLPVPIVYTATIDKFPVLTAAGMDAGYNYDDVCFARLGEITRDLGQGRLFVFRIWRCLIPDEERDTHSVRQSTTAPEGVVSWSVSSCQAGSENQVMTATGSVYAFILAPRFKSTKKATVIGWIVENGTAIMLVAILAAFAMFVMAYTCAWLRTFRKQYHRQRHAVDELRKEVHEMENYGGQAGTKDDEVVLIANPMVMHLKDEFVPETREELKHIEKGILHRKKEQNVRNKNLNEHRTERNRAKQELEQLQQQLLQAQDDTARPSVKVQSSTAEFEDMHDVHNHDDDDFDEGAARHTPAFAFDDHDF